MQLVQLEKGRTTQLFYLILGLLAVAMALTAKQEDPGLVATGLLLALISLYPFYFWLLGWSQGLPIWPVFAMVNGVTSALPMIQDPETLQNYSTTEIVIGGMTMGGFLALGTVVWLSMGATPPKVPARVLMIAREHSERYLFGFIVAGLIFQLNQLEGWIAFPGNTMQILRGVSVALNTMGIFVLAFYDGRGLLPKSQSLWLAVLATLTALASAAGLIMATAIVPVAMLLMGYTLGSGRIPWRALAAVFVIAAVLHPGKFAMRKLYWGEERPQFSVSMLPQFYMDWFTYGLEEMGLVQDVNRGFEDESKVSSIFERSGNLHMLLLVQQKSPEEVPFLGGITYEPIPRLLIPRFIDSEKGYSHAGNIMLTVNYGVQTIEQTKTTSIYWGLVPEAYANFGYVGVGVLAIVMGAFYSTITRLTVGVPMTSLRFVLGLLILGAATKADTMGVFITQQFQGVMGVTLAAFVLMRREPNPLAGGSGASAGDGRVAGAVAPVGRWGSHFSGRPRRLSGFGAALASAPPAGLPPVAADDAGATPPQLAPGAVQARKLPKWASHRQRAELAAAGAAAQPAPPKKVPRWHEPYSYTYRSRRP